MSVFFINEGTFEVGDDWDDKSVTALTFPSGSKVPEASFTVTRDPLSPTASAAIGDYVDEQLSKLARSCQQFDLIRRDD
ncbi:MAG TPA: DcrB-related protein, partial [Blastocatellia bacterium]|nr:DcrB-related protein [Blastocatellia bacterium]